MNGIKLLIIQGTPFCNINCSYCYLPSRNVKTSAPISLFDRVASRIKAEGLVGQQLRILWHAGEPLVYPMDGYEHCVAVFRHQFPDVDLKFAVQTNAVLIDDAWCRFFARHDVQVGVSIDGPAEMHDAFRITRSGKGTHAKALKGIACLKAHGIPFHVLAVVTKRTVAHPEALVQYFRELGGASVSFNLEEIDGENRRSTLEVPQAIEAAKDFYYRLFKTIASADAEVWCREYEHTLKAIVLGDGAVAQEATPLDIMSVDHRGNYYSFSPELMGMRWGDGDFALGNVYDDLPITSVRERHRALFEQIEMGVSRCRTDCKYFRVCGAGFTSNRYAEHKDFSRMETHQCRLSMQAPVEAMLKVMQELAIQAAMPASPLGSVE